MRRLLLPLPLPCLLLLPLLLLAEVRPRCWGRNRAREAGGPPRPLHLPPPGAAPAAAPVAPRGGVRPAGQVCSRGSGFVPQRFRRCRPGREGEAWGGPRRGPAEVALTWGGRRRDPRGLGLPRRSPSALWGSEPHLAVAWGTTAVRHRREYGGSMTLSYSRVAPFGA